MTTPREAAIRASGWGNTFNFSTGATYTLGNNVVVDGHFGWVRMTSNVEMSDVRENKGREWLGIPGTNGPNLWEGGLPFFDLDGYTDFGTIEALHAVLPRRRPVSDGRERELAEGQTQHPVRLGRLLHGHEPHPAGDPRRQLRSAGADSHSTTVPRCAAEVPAATISTALRSSSSGCRTRPDASS